MSAKGAQKGIYLVDQAISWIGSRIPDDWALAQRDLGGPEGSDSSVADAAIEIKGPQSYTTLAVAAREEFEPRDVAALTSGVARTIRALNSTPLLVVAPWLSARTRELLAAERINYVDLTGNAQIKLSNPALYLSSEGKARNPAPVERGVAKLRGRKAARLIRLLADVRPPYGVGQVAAATGLAQGYVSRLLDALDREALIERSARGGVAEVDVAALLRRWARSYEVLTANEASLFVAPRGAVGTMERFGTIESGSRIVVTGSFAAVRLAPVAAPVFLMAYCDDHEAIASELDLLPADEGANVALLRPFDPVVRAGAAVEGGVRFAAASQVAADCLTGIGRMPAEGEAVLRWIVADEPSRRLESLGSWSAA